MQIYTIRSCFTNNYYKLTGKSFTKEYKQNKKDEKENKSKEEMLRNLLKAYFLELLKIKIKIVKY